MQTLAYFMCQATTMLLTDLDLIMNVKLGHRLICLLLWCYINYASSLLMIDLQRNVKMITDVECLLMLEHSYWD